MSEEIVSMVTLALVVFIHARRHGRYPMVWPYAPSNYWFRMVTGATVVAACTVLADLARGVADVPLGAFHLRFVSITLILIGAVDLDGLLAVRQSGPSVGSSIMTKTQKV